MCLFAAYASLDRPFSFDQRHNPLVRRWMAQTIYKIGEAAGQVLAGLCPRESVETNGENAAGNGENGVIINRADPQESCNESYALLRCQLSSFFSERARRHAEQSKRQGPEPGAIVADPTILNFHLLNRHSRMAAANRTVNRDPYGRIDGTAHVTWRGRNSSIPLSDEVRAARAEGSCYLLCLQDLVREAEHSASFHTRRRAHPELQGPFQERWEIMMGSAHNREASALRQAVCIHLLNNADRFRSEFPVPLPMPEAEWLKLRAVSDSLHIQVDTRCEVQRWALAFLSPSTHADEGFMRVLLDWLCNKVAVLNLLQVPHVSGAPQFLHSSSVDHVCDESILLLKVLNIERHGSARVGLNHFDRVSGKNPVEFLEDLFPQGLQERNLKLPRTDGSNRGHRLTEGDDGVALRIQRAWEGIGGSIGMPLHSATAEELSDPLFCLAGRLQSYSELGRQVNRNEIRL